MKTLAIVALVSAVFYDIGWNADIREVPSVIHTSTRATHIPTRNDVDEFDERSGGTYGSLTDVRDGKTYKTVKIGSQVWMAENLNYEYNEGTAKSYCYGDDPAMCEKYGRLYTWSAAMDSAAVFSRNGKGCGDGKTCSATKSVRGVCPEGWHLPDTTEWIALEKFVADSLYNGATRNVGYALKSTSGWIAYNGEIGGGSDAFGFGALPAGYHRYSGTFLNVQSSAYFWSSTEYRTNYAYNRHLYYGSTDLYASNNYKFFARSVRCVKSTRATNIHEFDERSGGTYGSLTDVRDGKTYKTVKIGSQIWMAENLNYDYNQNTAKSYCYDNSADSCAKYGRLYPWSAAMDSAAVFSANGKGCGYGKTCSATKPVRGVCPEGWHLPDITEWSALEKFVADSLYNGATRNVGYALKSTSGWIAYNGEIGGSDAFGFGALPAGYHHYSGTLYERSFSNDQANGFFWSPTEVNTNYAGGLYLSYSDTFLNSGRGEKNSSFSVRCVKD